ncbi:MAG TPA: HlyD family efflux transporter periplasmic adaptor subunit [Gammaproteobacteria bacterium]|nr:HlyD family efflux transporter periplasmic adaptor subunit [Gammaproteobacteria bacterium]
MVKNRNQAPLPDDYSEPYIEARDDPYGHAPPQDFRGGDDRLPQLRDPGMPDHGRPWRQWHMQHADLDTAPLEVTAPKRPQWGRFLYILIILALALFAGNMIYQHVFWLNASGEVSGQQYQLSPSQTVRVEKVLVHPTDKVKKGQVLARFTSPQLQQALARDLSNIADLEGKMANGGAAPGSGGSIGSLKADIQSLQAQEQYLSRQLRQQNQQVDQLRQLVSQGAAAPADLQQARMQQAQTQSQYNQVQAKIRADRSRIHQLGSAQSKGQMQARLRALKQLRQSLKQRLGNLVLKAPAAGVVARVPATTGETLRAGQQAVVLVQRGTLRTYLYFPPAASDRLHRGQTLPITLPNGRHVPMRISKIYPSMQAVPQQLQPASGKQGNQAQVVVAAEPAGRQAEATLRQLESGTPVNARVSRWPVPESLKRLSVKLRHIL